MIEDPINYLKDIHWFPGHMNKASREIIQAYSRVDIFIEMLDSRIPFSSASPLLKDLRQGKPCLSVLSKADLADEKLTEVWKCYLQTGSDRQLMVADVRKRAHVRQVPRVCRELYIQAGGSKSRITAMVIGIPNSGKSTLINGLVGRTVAKAANEPAVTRQQQFVKVKEGFDLLDTPGITWPKIENSNSGFRLALTGAIRATAISHLDVALFAIHYLRSAHQDIFTERYKIKLVECSNESLLHKVGARRGCLIKGGTVDLDKASRVLLADIREGRLGRITWETPDMIASELLHIRLNKKQTRTKFDTQQG